MATNFWDYESWGNKFDPSKLGGAQQTFRYDPSWGGSGENSLASMLPMFVQQSPGALQSLGLAEADLGYVPGRYENDSYVADQWNLSDAAKKALSGLSVDELGYGGGKTVKALKDGDGNILGMSKPISPAGGDLLENAIMGIVAAGTGGILGQALGFLPGAMNPLQPSTWGGAATASNTGVPFELGNMGGATSLPVSGGTATGAAGSTNPLYQLGGASLGGTGGAAATSPYSLVTGSMAPGTTGALLGNTLGAAQSGLTATGAGLGLTGLGSVLGGGIGDSIGAGLDSTIGSSLKAAIRKAVGGQQGQPGGFNLGNLLGALGQMYQANQYQNSLDKLYGTLSDTGPYEAALRQELERRDAASGRRSQYGPREVELQAKMYDARSKNATTLAALTSNQNAALGSMLQGGMLAGTSSGLLNPKTGGLGQVGQDIWDGITDSDWWRDLFDFGG